MKLISVLSKLDQKTLQKAILFVESPYFNKDKNLVKAFQYIIESIQSTKPLTKELIWLKVYPDRPYVDAKLRIILNQLMTLLEHFLVVENTRENHTKYFRSLAEYSEQNQLIDLKNKLQKNLGEIQEKDLLSRSESFFDLYTALRYTRDIESDFEVKRGGLKRSDLKAQLATLNELLDASYAIEKMRLVLLQDSFLELVEDEEFFIQSGAIKEIAGDDIMKKYELVGVYYKVFDLLINGNQKLEINIFIEYLQSIVEKNRKEALHLYISLTNYVARQINLGRDLNRDSFELLRFGLESNLLLTNNEINPSDYRNIVHAACRLKEFNWALEFVEKYKANLSTEYRQSAYSFSKARIFNNMGDHHEVLNVLRNVEYEDMTYNLNSRLMLIIAFYELDEFETLDHTINAFKVFLRRHRNISSKRKGNFRDFCNVVYNIARASSRKDNDRILKAFEIISNNHGIPNTWWLEEKIKEVSEVLGFSPENQKSVV